MKHIKLFVGRIIFWLGRPLWRMLTRGTVRTRVAVIVGNDLLLTKATLGDGSWGLPGGGVHKGEDILVAACRELREEVGIRLGPKQCRTIASEMIDTNHMAYTAVFIVAKLAERPATTSSLEIAECRWVSLSKVADWPIDRSTSRLLELL